MRSPSDGLVIERDLVPGNHYDSQESLLVIGQSDVLQVTAVVDPVQAREVEFGRWVRVTVMFGAWTFDARTERFKLDPSSGEVTIRTTIRDRVSLESRDAGARRGRSIGRDTETGFGGRNPTNQV